MAPTSSSSSSSLNDSLSELSHHFLDPCFYHKQGSLLFAAYNIITLLLLIPLCTCIVHHGVQQWRKGSASLSHADVITFHMVAMELFGLSGMILSCGVIFSKQLNLLFLGKFFYFNWLGQLFFHILTCVERHLAVVYPVTYRSLKGRRGIRMRNVSIGGVWLICCVEVGFEKNPIFSVVDFCFMGVSVTVISFCSLGVLRALIRPGPGGRGGTKEWLDQSKQRAFYTILVILVVLLLRFVGDLMWNILSVRSDTQFCVLKSCTSFFGLPSNLVLPLLFLHRAGKLKCHRATPAEA